MSVVALLFLAVGFGAFCVYLCDNDNQPGMYGSGYSYPESQQSPKEHTSPRTINRINVQKSHPTLTKVNQNTKPNYQTITGKDKDIILSDNAEEWDMVYDINTKKTSTFDATNTNATNINITIDSTIDSIV